MLGLSESVERLCIHLWFVMRVYGLKLADKFFMPS